MRQRANAEVLTDNCAEAKRLERLAEAEPDFDTADRLRNEARRYRERWERGERYTPNF